MLITGAFAYVLNTWVLVYAPYLRLISFIIVIASAVQFVEMALKKLSPDLFKALGIFLPLITTNCAILGLALFTTNKGYGFIEGMVYALGAGGGVTLALVLLAGIREETKILNIPDIMQGTALHLIIAGILSMAFMGFAGFLVHNDDAIYNSDYRFIRTLRRLGLGSIAGQKNENKKSF